jgi:hypothetical protein
VNNKQHTIAIMDALNGIADINDFIAYCRENKEEIKFASKTEKLDTLAHKYKKEQIEKRLPKSKARKYAEKLAKKVKDICVWLDDNWGANLTKVLRKDNGERYFEDHEIRMINSLGGIPSAVSKCRDYELEDAICDRYLEASRNKMIGGKVSGESTKALGIAKSIAKEM